VTVLKSQRELILMKDAQVLKTYRVSLGPHPVGAKNREGDGKTPEGNYTLDRRNPRSRYHLSLHVSYPDAGDIARAQRLGVAPGGDIMVHGLPNGLGWLGGLHRYWNWTNGCIAVTNPEIEEIWELVPTGTHVEIRP
jgi:murein L,D-transpeptidase YafK